LQSLLNALVLIDGFLKFFMIYLGSQLIVADNSGAKIVECFHVDGSTGTQRGDVGSTIVCSVKDAMPNMKVKKGQVVKAIIVRTKSRIRRADGSYVSFDDNAAVLLDKKGELIGTRVLGPVAREIRTKGFLKIASLASEII
jgi:large subunit ribosomal protein L14